MTSPLSGKITNTVKGRSKGNSELASVTFFHLDSRSAVSVAIVADDDSISLLPLEGEPVLVLEVNPLLPLSVSELGMVSESELDWSVFSLKLLDTGPWVKPHVMVSDWGIDNVTIETGSVLKGGDIELGLHVLFFTKMIFSPGNLKATLFCSSLSCFWAFGHEGSLPVVVDRRLIFSFVSGLVGQVSPVAETSVFEFLTQFGCHQFICHTDCIRKISRATKSSKGVLAWEGDLCTRFAYVCHFVVIMKVSLFGGSSFVEVGLKLSSGIGTSFVFHVVHKTDLNILFQLGQFR